MDEMFQKFADYVSKLLGSMRSFIVVLVIILGSGVIFRFSESWQKIVGLTVTIATFLILFFVQKSQNVSSKAAQAKLDELIRAVSGARNEFASAEKKEEKEIENLNRAISDDEAKSSATDAERL